MSTIRSEEAGRALLVWRSVRREVRRGMRMRREELWGEGRPARRKVEVVAGR